MYPRISSFSFLQSSPFVFPIRGFLEDMMGTPYPPMLYKLKFLLRLLLALDCRYNSAHESIKILPFSIIISSNQLLFSRFPTAVGKIREKGVATMNQNHKKEYVKQMGHGKQEQNHAPEWNAKLYQKLTMRTYHQSLGS